MLWAYFDESGVHAPKEQGSRLLKLAAGGCIAPLDAWESLSISWADAIDRMGIEQFHMADFENRAKPFDKWSDGERKKNLNILLDIIGSAKPNCFGFTNPARADDSTSSMYERCVHDTLVELSMHPEEFAIVFAHHPEYARHSELHGKMAQYGLGQNIRSCTTALPIDVHPLQAADLVAYEIGREERHSWTIPRRYPLRRLHDLGCTFRLGGAVE